uniref:Methyltransferase type 11 n=1 Tax=Cyanothece sp. (strain PCC 7425 / ATCC 29141) TaxID=395961 RepID=B8HJK2_CYAP4
MTAIFEHNHQVFTTQGIVRYYSQLRLLQPAEQTILELFRDQWPRMKMLDIGVGGGRTTQHFSPLVKEYVGIDYSRAMITACQKRFPLSSPARMFEVGDARQMSQFPDHSFDFIFFSFNGIDSLSHADRLKVFQEVRRVGKPGGYFFFSSHNLQGLEQQLNWRNQVNFNPLSSYVNLIMLALLRFCNRSMSLDQIKQSDHAMIQDESHNFRLKQYYVRPVEQIRQLEVDFEKIRVFSWKSGLEMSSDRERCSNTDLWLYYLCTIKP